MTLGKMFYVRRRSDGTEPFLVKKTEGRFGHDLLHKRSGIVPATEMEALYICRCTFAPGQKAAKGRLSLAAEEHPCFPDAKGRQDDECHLPPGFQKWAKGPEDLVEFPGAIESREI